MSVWVISRATGLGALWLLVLSAAAGYAARTLCTAVPAPANGRARGLRFLRYVHRAAAGAGWVAALVHAWLLRYDPSVPFGWKALWIPGAAPYRPLWTGLGTLTLYGWGLILISFDGARSRWMPRFSRLHGLSPLVLGLAAAHAAGAGSDLHLLSVRVAAGLAMAVAVAALVERRVRRRDRGIVAAPGGPGGGLAREGRFARRASAGG